MIGRHYLSVAAAVAGLGGMALPTAQAAAPAAPTVISDIDLAKAFATRSPWRFTATQGPEIPDPVFEGRDVAPGVITLCLRPAPSAACDPELRSTWPAKSPDSGLYADLHYLLAAKIVRSAPGRRPLLWIQATSLHSVDGGHIISTQALAYRPSEDRFVRVYERRTGSNHNEETRFIADGSLKGDIISVEPTQNAPFGYWVSISASTSRGPYRQVLRYRSATRYNDGNALTVIDSEMPNIEQRLGVWRAGKALPLPARACPKPRLIRKELWCD